MQDILAPLGFSDWCHPTSIASNTVTFNPLKVPTSNPSSAAKRRHILRPSCSSIARTSSNRVPWVRTGEEAEGIDTVRKLVDELLCHLFVSDKRILVLRLVSAEIV
ncbi:hypothetical protein VTL71DRAFT_1236, partial [Oculimacula yallundae]